MVIMVINGFYEMIREVGSVDAISTQQNFLGVGQYEEVGIGNFQQNSIMLKVMNIYHVDWARTASVKIIAFAWFTCNLKFIIIIL